VFAVYVAYLVLYPDELTVSLQGMMITVDRVQRNKPLMTSRVNRWNTFQQLRIVFLDERYSSLIASGFVLS
jgi:hypothetical protein